jgi:hypothetical protein
LVSVGQIKQQCQCRILLFELKLPCYIFFFAILLSLAI